MSEIARVCVDSDFFEVNPAGELTRVPCAIGFGTRLVFETPGSFAFTKATYPHLCAVFVRAVGGGGGSVGATGAAGAQIRIGGSGGGYGEAWVPVGSLGVSETVIVGAGGAAAASGTGGTGGTSSFGAFAIGTGGNGGTSFMTAGTTVLTEDSVDGPTNASQTGSIVRGGGASGVALRLSGTVGVSGAGGDSAMGSGGGSRTSEGPGLTPKGRGGGAGGGVSYGASISGTAGGVGTVVLDLYFG